VSIWDRFTVYINAVQYITSTIFCSTCSVHQIVHIFNNLLYTVNINRYGSCTMCTLTQNTQRILKITK
jgi:hypothetical protein